MGPAAHRLLRPALVGAGLFVIAAVALARTGEVIARGELLPFFEQYDVAQVRVLGFELYVDTSSGLSDVVSVCALALVALVLLAGARAAVDDAGLRRTLTDAALGSAFLAADDLLAVHETIGHNLAPLAGLPGIDHPDDVIVGLYGLAVCAFAWRHRSLLTGAVLRAWIVAAGCGGLAVLHDLTALHLRVLEEGLEIIAAGALVVAAWLLVREALAEQRALAPAMS